MEINYKNNILSKDQSLIRKSIYDKVLERELVKRENNQLKDFNFMSASLSRFLPNVPVDKHWDIYIKIISTMRMREFDLTDLHKISDKVTYTKNDVFGSETPKIYITCHLGFCKASISLLILNGVNKIALIVDDLTYRRQAETILKINDNFKNQFGLDNEFKIVNVEKPNTALEMMQLIKQGFSLFAYIDGNSGYKGVYNKEKTIEIPFLESSICTRTGLSKIAYFMDVPIVPFLAYYEEVSLIPRVKFFEEIKKNSSESIDDFTIQSTIKIYKLFEEYIENYFDQWESWFYIHKYLPKEILASKEVLLSLDTISSDDFKNNKLSVFKIDDGFYLFNRIDFNVFPIFEEVYIKLKEYQDGI